MINLSMADPEHNLRPRLTVIGVGGAGGNAINNMIRCQLEGCDFIAANTDSQALAMSLANRKIQLGVNLSRGLGAGSKSDVGRAAAEEQINDIMACLEGSDMLFVTAGMGGGTGTGAAPVIARAARESGILTVGVVTKPFHFEGNNRMRQAESGIADLQQYVDTLIVIPNQNLFRIANERTTFAEAFRLADEVLHCGVRGITDLMVMPGFMNLDFADVKTVMGEMGKAMMGTGEAEGDDRAVHAAEAAISNPLLDDVSMKGARGVLINITGGLDMTLFEVDQAANRIREEVDPEAQIKVGSTLGESLEGKIRVSVIATGIDAAATQRSSSSSPSSSRTPSQKQPQAKTQPQTAYAQPAYPQSSHPVAQQQPVQQQAVQQQPASSQTSYFTMPQAIMPHADVIPHTSPVEATQPEQQAQAPKIQEQAAPRNTAIENEDKAPVVESRAAEPVVEQPEREVEEVREEPTVSRVQPKPTPAPDVQAHRSARPASPMAQNDMRMTQLTPQSQSSPADQRRHRRAESLFTRITGFGLVRPSSQHQDDELHDPSMGDEGMGGPHLDVRPSERPVLSEQPDDLLEIPAFLRRQSNH
ncbi:MAG: cell division protein FtsZ [Alphaproteobacteria bacterium]|nr:cell division protein FtsZ [Alphaproteobacteria bacterium]